MFGYIRPYRPELKVREYDGFRECYCGLCHAMGKRYGIASRFILNFDFVYLAMLLWDPEDSAETVGKRCIACPLRKKRVCRTTRALVTSAGMGVILTWWKLRDSIKDESFFGSLKFRLASLVLRPAYRRAARDFPDFDRAVRDRLDELGQLESAREPSIDRTADRFAVLLSAAAQTRDEPERRALEQLLYQTGRWIYIVDACDDLKEDCTAARYNPVAARYGITTGELTAQARDALESVLSNSRNLAGLAFELMPETPWTGVIRNIIYLGMPAVASAVLSGQWKMPSNRLKNNR